jgi:hypothetical protein
LGQNFTFLTNHLLDTTLSFIVFWLELLVLSIAGFAVYLRRTRWM